MPSLKPRLLVTLLMSALVPLILGACGSTMFPTPTPTVVGQGTPPSATPGQLSPLAAQGQQLFSNYKCAECHSLAGERIVGPPLNGLYGSKVTLTNGQTVVADDKYLKLAILEPDAQIVNGYASGIMSSHIQVFQSQIAQGNNLDALIAFIKSQK